MVVKRTVKDLRIERNLSQRALSEMADVAIETISRIERGHISPQDLTLQRIATALGVTRDSILIEARSSDHAFSIAP